MHTATQFLATCAQEMEASTRAELYEFTVQEKLAAASKGAASVTDDLAEGMMNEEPFFRQPTENVNIIPRAD